MLSPQKIDSISRFIEGQTKDALNSGDTIHQAIRRIMGVAEQQMPDDVRIIGATLDLWLGDDEDWNNRLVNAGYLPIREDERV